MNWMHIVEVASGVAIGFVVFVAAYLAAMPLIIRCYTPWLSRTGTIKDTVPEAEPDTDAA